MNPLIFVLSLFEETYMLFMYYSYIRGEDLTDYAQNSTWDLLHAYIYAYSQRLIDQYTGYGVQAISRM